MFYLENNDNLIEALRITGLSQLNNSNSVITKIQPILKRDTEESFPNQKSPEGKIWKQSEAAKKENRLTLVDSGELSENLIYKNKGNEIYVMASELASGYGFKHQFGGPSRLANGDEILLPPRPFAGLTQKGKKEIENIIINSFFNF